MKSTRSLLQCLLFIGLSCALYVWLSQMAIASSSVRFSRTTPLTLLYLGGGALCFTVLGTAVLGFFALLINRLNPLGQYCKVFLLPLALLFFGYTCTEVYEQSPYMFNNDLSLMIACIICGTHLYMTLKLYAMLGYSEHTIIVEQKRTA